VRVASAGVPRKTSKAIGTLAARCRGPCQTAQAMRGRACRRLPSTATKSRNAAGSAGGSVGRDRAATSRRTSRSRAGSKAAGASASEPRLTRRPPVASATFWSEGAACKARRLVRAGWKKESSNRAAERSKCNSRLPARSRAWPEFRSRLKSGTPRSKYLNPCNGGSSVVVIRAILRRTAFASNCRAEHYWPGRAKKGPNRGEASGQPRGLASPEIPP
jgi:hypothetical protein